MPKIIILRGNSGSGKSTVAKALQRKLGRGALLVQQDYVRREMLWVRDEPGNVAVDLLQELVDYGRRNCAYTILEGILYAEIYESLFNMIREDFSGRVFAYYFDLPFEETLRRHRMKPNAHEFGEPEMRRWWSEKDCLTGIDERILSMDMSLEDIVDRIYNDLMNDK